MLSRSHVRDLLKVEHDEVVVYYCLVVVSIKVFQKLVCSLKTRLDSTSPSSNFAWVM